MTREKEVGANGETNNTMMLLCYEHKVCRGMERKVLVRHSNLLFK